MNLAVPSIGGPEILLIIFVLVLLFGAKKLPELARGSGRALRIFKSETKGLMDDDNDDVMRTSGSTSTQAQIGPSTTGAQPSTGAQPAAVAPPQAAVPVFDSTSESPAPAQTLPPTHTERDR